MDSEDLVTALREGKAWAPHALVTTVAPVLLGYAALVGGGLSSVDQELAVEAAIARGIRKIDLYDPARGSFATWLRPFVRHAIADIRRRGSTTSLPEAFASRADEEPQAPEQSHLDEVNALRHALTRLTPTDRLILQLRETEQLSYEQCAERIGGVTAGACRVRHFRALKRLAESARDEPSLARYFEETNT